MTKYIQKHLSGDLLGVTEGETQGQRWRETEAVRDGLPALDMKQRSTACCVLPSTGR